ncbi:hypothetical protein CsSME_00010345 [Camellia sinensis var. sinensis]
MWVYRQLLARTLHRRYFSPSSAAALIQEPELSLTYLEGLPNQIKKLVNHLGRSFFLSRLFDLEVRSDFESDEITEKVRVLPRKIHLHADTDAVLNVTFIRAPSHALLKVDLSGLDVGQKLVMGDLNVHPALKLIQSKDQPDVSPSRKPLIHSTCTL